jgi:hypothetical protein
MTKVIGLSDFRKLGFTHELSKLSGTYTIDVSPELAQSWLALNPINRKLSEAHVIEYVNRMKRGEWMLNGQCIIFSDKGILLDGQHRLAAVARAKMTIAFDVRFGIDQDVFATIDDGKKRSASDVFSIEKIPNYSNAAATVNLIMGLQRGVTQKNFNMANKPSNTEKAEWYLENPEVADFVLLGMKWYEASGRILSPAKFAAYAFMMAKVDHKKAMRFMDKLALGFELESSSPIFKLRALLTRAKVDRTRKIPESYERALIIKAWNTYKEGRKIKILKFDTVRDPFPTF